MAPVVGTPWRLARTAVALLILSQLIGTTTAGVTISILFKTFRNPTEHDYWGKCCDLFCHQQCDHYFVICLDSMTGSPGSVETHDGDRCHYFKRTTNMFNEENLNTFDHDMHGIANPIVLNKPRWEGLAFKVTVMDRDSSGPPDLVDTFDYTFDKQPTPKQQILRGQRSKDKTSLAVEFDVQCDEEFFGDTCETHCKPRQDVRGHFTCDDKGRRLCAVGWQGIDRNCTLACPQGFFDGAGCVAAGSASGGQPPNVFLIVGIVVGLLLLLLIIIVIIIAILWNRHRRKTEKKDQGVSATVSAVTVEQQTPTSTGVGTTGHTTSDGLDDNKRNAGLEATSHVNMTSQTPGHAFVQTQSYNSNAFSQTPSHAHTQTREHGNAYNEIDNPRNPRRGATSVGMQAGDGPPPYTVSADETSSPRLVNNSLYGTDGAYGGSSVKDMASYYEEPIKMKL